MCLFVSQLFLLLLYCRQKYENPTIKINEAAAGITNLTKRVERAKSQESKDGCCNMNIYVNKKTCVLTPGPRMTEAGCG